MARKRERTIREMRRGNGDVAKAAADVLGSLTRLGLTLASLPASFLPSDLRDDVFDLTQNAAHTSAHFPRAVADALDQFADDLQSRAERSREDLGRRRRRERRRRAPMDEPESAGGEEADDAEEA